MIRFTPRDARPLTRETAALRPYSGVTARLLWLRGVTTSAQADAFMHPALEQLHDPFLMHGMKEAVSLIAQAKESALPVVVYGDYDVDGICACALLVEALRRYGVNAQHHTPLRSEGYGLNQEAVTELAQRYKLLITVDLGITNHEEVRLAQSLGMKVIVTDHHGLALEESPADAVMNPLLGDYPFRRLCGTGVAFKLAQALLGSDACQAYLDLAALATVADIVPLRDENRVLVACGLPCLQAAKRPGIKALLAVSGDPSPITADTLGFQLGPRLNAAGRIGDAGKAVRLMLTDDPKEAEAIAQELDTLNTQRKQVESQLVREAEKAAVQHDFIKEPALVITGDDWHVGVIGLAAGRLCQRYACPVCVLSRSEGLLHGSLRSVPGVHIHHCLQACDDLLLRYGGHELAAGVTLSAENEAAFRQRLQAEVAKADPSAFVPSQPYDGEVALADCTDALYDELNLLAPFGCDNPAPLLLLRGACPEERRAVGSEGAHLKLTLRQNDRVMGGIAFGMGALASSLPDKVDAVFALGRNTFRGVTSLQAEVKALLPDPAAREQAFQAADGEREQGELLSAMESGLSDAAGKAPFSTECIKVTLNADDFRQAVARQSRGVLAVAYTHAGARLGLSAGEMDVTRGAPSDPRCFHTLLCAPVRELTVGCWSEVWLLDGELFPGESALWQARLPHAAVYALPVSDELRALARRLSPTDESCRAVYKAIRRVPCRSLLEAAQQAGVSAGTARMALSAFSKLGLVDYTPSPFAYALKSSAPCKLDDSPLIHALRALAHGKDD